MASSSSSSRKRSIGAIELRGEEEDVDHNGQQDLIFEPFSPSYTFDMAAVAVTDKEKAKFERITEEAQKDCVRAVSRLFLFKGK